MTILTYCWLFVKVSVNFTSFPHRYGKDSPSVIAYFFQTVLHVIVFCDNTQTIQIYLKLNKPNNKQNTEKNHLYFYCVK